ncbi:hypothetical protein MTO98_05095 [Mucilaginibacter sp. SMC90]|uniref:hypothetical protein n=1 Tax=Mucilaginibacter sp. SMC90 TaxID=2929803 RepID=UPI001FB290BC|nr:hypothetical protein [Mucilaginibacter sp. SMC90]UOE50450.1 hypothetical protein MTO98_05095 [Mucilaginibacter sp. SMC90]
MTTHYIKHLFAAFVIIIFISYALPVSAQLSAAVRYKPILLHDTSAHGLTEDNYSARLVTGMPDKPLVDNADAGFESDLESELDTHAGRKKLMGYLKEFSAGNTSETNYNQAKVKTYYKLANVFAKLHLYPLAMKCFFRAMVSKKDANNFVPAATDSVSMDTTGRQLHLNSGLLAINANDDSVFVNAPVQLKDKKEKKSKSITYNRIVNTFNDGKKAAAYALLFHVKQPKPGKPTVFVRANTGHTFITLIKYNTDSTTVSVSFGFYPKKDNIFSATPWEPETSGTFKNDEAHQWDEVMGKFITERRFKRILKLTRQYDGLEYHLSKNNCTDFALQAASYAGFGVTNSKGSWPLGHGNNPATTGQSIIAGGIYDNDKTDLFIDFDEALK